MLLKQRPCDISYSAFLKIVSYRLHMFDYLHFNQVVRYPDESTINYRFLLNDSWENSRLLIDHSWIIIEPFRDHSWITPRPPGSWQHEFKIYGSLFFAFFCTPCYVDSTFETFPFCIWKCEKTNHLQRRPVRFLIYRLLCGFSYIASYRDFLYISKWGHPPLRRRTC